MSDFLHLTALNWHKQSRRLEVTFSNDTCFDLSLEYLRVFSPSAEVQGHGPDQAVLQTGKQFVNLNRIEPVGQYALRLVFDDGHDSGLYTWRYLYELGLKYSQNWQQYLHQLRQAGKRRQPQDTYILKLD